MPNHRITKKHMRKNYIHQFHETPSGETVSDDLYSNEGIHAEGYGNL